MDYDQVAYKYDNFYKDGNFQIENESIRELLSPHLSGEILDIGCGTGLFLDIFFGIAPGNYYGLDPSKRMIEIAKLKFPEHAFYFRQHKINDNEVLGDFDAYIALFGSATYLNEIELEMLKEKGKTAFYFLMHYRDGYSGQIGRKLLGETLPVRSYQIEEKFKDFPDVNLYRFGDFVIATNRQFDLEPWDEMSDTIFQRFVDRNSWIFAIKFAKFAPHEYVCKHRISEEDQRIFDQIVYYIRENGFVEIFKGREYVCYVLNGKKYWTMGDPMETTYILNRTNYEDLQ